MQVGLILFVYTVGLTSGSGFFASLKKKGVKFNIALVCSLAGGGLATLVIGIWMQLQPGQIAGVFCGGLTNTPALAAVTELLSNSGIGDVRNSAVGYSMAYPFGIIGGLLAFQLFYWLYRKDAEKEKTETLLKAKLKSSVLTSDFEITNPDIFGKAIGELRVQEKTGLIISRCEHNEVVTIPTKYTILQQGDIVSTVGPEIKINEAEKFFGTKSSIHIDEKKCEITIRRILVSNKKLAGKSIQEIELDRRFNAQITRLRRSDIELVPDHETTIEIGDRVRVVMPTDKSAEVVKFFGDSERSISDLDYTALTLGISFGVLLGMIPIPVPGGNFVSLGFAGGPLVSGLILGKLGRTGGLVWSLPSESNFALRHIGLLFFLAAVGIMAGGSFFDALTTNSGLKLFGLGLITTSITTLMTLFLLRHFGKGTIVEAVGATSGMQTQPATLARAYEMSQSDDTYVSYATTYPVAMVGKILIAQLLVILSNLFLK